MRISDWSSDVCSSDLGRDRARTVEDMVKAAEVGGFRPRMVEEDPESGRNEKELLDAAAFDLIENKVRHEIGEDDHPRAMIDGGKSRSEEHTSELQSLMRNSYAVFCLKTK